MSEDEDVEWEPYVLFLFIWLLVILFAITLTVVYIFH